MGKSCSLPVKVLLALVLAVGLLPPLAFAEGTSDASRGEGQAEQGPSDAAEPALSSEGAAVVVKEDAPAKDPDDPMEALLPVADEPRVVEEAPGAGLGLSVGWDEPSCGVPTVFHLSGKGGTGPYEYYLGAIYLYQTDGLGYEMVTDPSKHGANGYVYQSSGEISFTFYASGSYQLHFYVMDKSAPPYKTERRIVNVQVSDPDHPSIDAIADSVVAECLAKGNKTDFEKALWLHDWVVDHCEYDGSLLFCSAEGALARGKGTCESYHRAYVKLLRRAGIETGRVEGNGHVWTAVKMDGEWYQVDVTWDRTEQFAGYPDLKHLHFGLTDEITTLVHSDHKPMAGYESNSFKNNYFIKTGKIAEWSDPYVSRIQSQLDAGVTTFTVSIDHAQWAPSYKDILYNLVAYDLAGRDWKAGSTPVRLAVTYAADTLSVRVTPAFTVITSGPSVTTPVYNGKTQVGVRAAAGGQYALSGTTQAVNAGSYVATAKPAKGFAWNAQGDVASKTYNWRIAPAPIGGSGVSVSGVRASYLHTGAAIRPVPAVTFNGVRLVQGKDYTVSWKNEVKAGTATVVIQGMGNFTGTRSVNYRIVPPVTAALSADQRTVTVTLAAEAAQGASSVAFPTWSLEGGQDDIVWYLGRRTASGAWTATVPVSSHRSSGAYAVHAYASAGGAQRFAGSASFEVAAPSARVSITQTAAQRSAGRFTVSVALSSPSGAKRVQVPVWSAAGGQDDIEWLEASRRPDGTWAAEASMARPGRAPGRYVAHAYATCGNGVFGYAGQAQADASLSPAQVSIALSRDQRTATVTASGGWFAMASSVAFPTWSLEGGQDDIVWYLGRRTASGAWTATVPVSSHRSSGAYAVHAYASAGGAQRFAGSASFEVAAPSARVSITQTAAQRSAGRFTVSVALSSPSGAKRVQVPVWSAAGGQDDIEWLEASRRPDGTWAAEASMARPGRAPGRYVAHAYATCGNGVFGYAGQAQADVVHSR